ncbi:MAG: protein kinase [Rhizobacter sp.]
MELIGSGNCIAPGFELREYRLLGVVGEGGFGIVYRAYDSGLHRTVAIKEYMPSALARRGIKNQIEVHPQHRDAFDAGLRSFISEARMLAKFSHPALVHVYRFFEENGTAYMVMRSYEGQTFRAFLAEQHNGIDERWLTSMLCPILDGLEMLHAADCFHRDIAPDNVLLRASGMPVLLDFGAARRIIGDMTQALTMVLKPGYAPIEQYADDGAMPQGAWTDIYQLGALLFRAITGHVPTTSVARMVNDPIRMLTPTEYPGYSAQFLRGVHQALSVMPADRPQSIAELKVLLGVEGFSMSEFWAASEFDARPVDLLLTPDDENAYPDPESRASATIADSPASEFTTVQLADSLAHETLIPTAADPSLATSPVPQDLPNSLHPRQTTSHTITLALHSGPPQSAHATEISVAPTTQALAPTGKVGLESGSQAAVSANPPALRPNESIVNAPADTTLWQPPATYLATQQDDAPNAPSKNPTVYWVRAAAMTAAVAMLAGFWLLLDSQRSPKTPMSQQPLASVADQKAWEAVKKSPTVANLQAYLAAHPSGEQAATARTMLASLSPPKPPAAPASAAVPPVAQGMEASVSDAAAKEKVSTPAEVRPPPSPESAVKSTPAPAATNPQAAVNPSPSPAPAVTRPRPEATPRTDVPAAAAVEIKPPAQIATGTVSLRVTPWGNVRVNRSPVGSTPPLTQLNLPEGQHQIEISNADGAKVTKTVQVTKGEVVVIDHKFD